MASNDSSVQLPLILALARTDAQPKGLFCLQAILVAGLQGIQYAKPAKAIRLTPAAMVTITSWRVISGGIYLASCAVVKPGDIQLRVARYYVLAVCDACGGLDLRKMVQFNDGPTVRQSIGEAYSGKTLPPDLLDLPGFLLSVENQALLSFNRIMTRK